MTQRSLCRFCNERPVELRNDNTEKVRCAHASCAEKFNKALLAFEAGIPNDIPAEEYKDSNDE